MQRVIFEDVAADDAAELYRLRAAQLGRTQRQPSAQPESAQRFAAAIRWAKEKGSFLTALTLLEVARRPVEYVWMGDVAAKHGLDPAKLRGALGAFWRSAGKLGFDSATNPVLEYKVDALGRVAYRATHEQALVIKEELETWLEDRVMAAAPEFAQGRRVADSELASGETGSLDDFLGEEPPRTP